MIEKLRGFAGAGLGRDAKLTLTEGRYNLFVPSNSTLNAYKPPVDYTPGVREDAIKSFATKVLENPLKFCKRIHICTDGVSCNAGLVFMRGKCIGSTKGSLDVIVDKNKISELVPLDLASEILVVIISTLCGKLSRAVAWLPVNGCNFEINQKLIDSVIMCVNKFGLVATTFAVDCLSSNIKLFKLYMSNQIIICFADYVHWLKLLVHPLRINKDLCFQGVKISFNVIYKYMKRGFFSNLSITFDMCPNDMQKVAPLLRVLADWVILELKGFDSDPEAHALAEFFSNVRSAFRCFDIKLTMPSLHNASLLQPKPVLSLESRSLELQRILAYLQQVQGQTSETQFASRLNVDSFVALLAKLSPEDWAFLKPRILGSDFCETFFSIMKSHFERFGVWQFAQAFSTNNMVAESEQAGFHATGIVSVSNKSRNNFIDDVHDQDAGLLVPQEAKGHIAPLERTIRPKLTLPQKYDNAQQNLKIAQAVKVFRDQLHPDLFAQRNTHSIRASYHRQKSGTVRDNSHYLDSISEDANDDEDDVEIEESKTFESAIQPSVARVAYTPEKYFWCPIKELGCTHPGYKKKDGKAIRTHIKKHFRNLLDDEFDTPYKHWLTTDDWLFERYPPHNTKVSDF